MIAVLTGDLVRSTKMSNDIYAGAISSLKRSFKEAKSKHQASGEIYRGDGFQVQFPDPIYALEYTLTIKLALQSAKFSDKPVLCTMSLAYGSYDFLDEKPNTSMGPVFIESGRGLDNTSRGDLSLSFESGADNYEYTMLTRFLNHLINNLTKSQAQLLCQYIEGGFAEHKEIARITGTSRQNISNRLANIGADLVRDYIEFINTQVITMVGTS